MSDMNQTRRLKALSDMLGRLNARCMWTVPGPIDTGIKQIECYLIGSPLVMIQIFEEGWDYFVGGEYGALGAIERHLETLSGN